MKGREKGRRGGSNCSNLEWIDGFGRAQITRLHRHIKAGCQTSPPPSSLPNVHSAHLARWNVGQGGMPRFSGLFSNRMAFAVLYSARMSFNTWLKCRQVKLRQSCFCVKPETTIISSTKAGRSISIAQTRGWYLHNTSNHQLVKESCDTTSISYQ